LSLGYVDKTALALVSCLNEQQRKTVGEAASRKREAVIWVFGQTLF
jgi:hypothetical protein